MYTNTHYTAPSPGISNPTTLVHVPQTQPSTTQASITTVEHLLRMALVRLKDRVVSYILIQVITLAVCFATLAGLGLNIFFHLFMFVVTESAPISALSGVFFFVMLSVFFVYFAAWGQLASFNALISDKQTGAFAYFQEVKPLVWHFVGLQALMSLFFFGLFPFALPTVMLLFILWQFWSCFTVFSFIRERQKGLASLWTSYRVVNSKFWEILGRVVILYLIVVLFSIGFNLLTTQETAFVFVQMIFSYLTVPFAFAYLYEIYRQLEVPQEVQPPKVWIWLSVAGWTIMLLIIYFGTSSLISDPSVLFQDSSNQDIEQFFNQLEQAI